MYCFGCVVCCDVDWWCIVCFVVVVVGDYFDLCVCVFIVVFVVCWCLLLFLLSFLYLYGLWFGYVVVFCVERWVFMDMFDEKFIECFVGGLILCLCIDVIVIGMYCQVVKVLEVV